MRAFCPGLGAVEDPATGSLNAGLAQWLAGDVLPASYVATRTTVAGLVDLGGPERPST